jgi:hypothetical protein
VVYSGTKCDDSSDFERGDFRKGGEFGYLAVAGMCKCVCVCGAFRLLDRKVSVVIPNRILKMIVTH